MSVIVNSQDGRLAFAEGNQNELEVDSKVEDPPALRLGSPAGTALGKISGDHLAGSRKEKTLIIFKDEPGIGGVFEFYAQRPGTEDDANMVRLARLSNAGFELLVPGGSGPAMPGFAINSPNGVFRFQVQDDGNAVLYRMTPTITPIWASNTSGQ